LGVSKLNASSIRKNSEYYFENNLDKDESLNHIIKLFMFARPVSFIKAEEIFGKKILDIMSETGLLESRQGEVIALVDIYPCSGYFIATDHIIDESNFEDYVNPVSNDSYCLSKSIPRGSFDNALNLCTGSGVQAIVSSKYSRKIIGVDNNSRAINFAKFNALLNQVSNVEFRQGDLYEAVRGEKFDLIIANPHFTPAQDILGKIVSGLPEHLKMGGTVRIASLLAFTDDYYNKKLKSMLKSREFNILTLIGQKSDVESYVKSHFQYEQDSTEKDDEIKELILSYKQAGILVLADGLISMGRTSGDTPIDEVKNFRYGSMAGCVKEISNWFKNVGYFDGTKNRKSLENGKYSLSPDLDLKKGSRQLIDKKHFEIVFKETSAYFGEIIPWEVWVILDCIDNGIAEGIKIKERFMERVSGDSFEKDKLFTYILAMLLKDSFINHEQ
jgi:carbamoyltransferase